MADLDKAIREWVVRCYPECDSYAEAIVAVPDLHKPWNIYDECGHHHTITDPDVVDVEWVGLVCSEGLAYTVCASCCTDADGDQTGECASIHDHGAHCPTVRAIADALGVEQ